MATTLGAIFNQVALIAGGSTADDTGRYTGAGGIAGIAEAWSRVPDAITQPKTLIVYPRRGPYKNPHEEKFKQVHHDFFFRLFFTREGPTSEQTVNEMLPFVESVYNAYAAKVTLNGACNEFWLTQYSVIVAPFNGIQWLALQFDCEATEIDTSVIFTP